MGSPAELYDPRPPRRAYRARSLSSWLCRIAIVAASLLAPSPHVPAQTPHPEAIAQHANSDATLLTPELRARRFLRGRNAAAGLSPAQAIATARRQHLELLHAQLLHPQTSSLSASWQPLGPLQVSSLAFKNVTGRVTSLAIDPADSTGNTLYAGTTGGGIWKSTNAAGPTSSITFTPLTDTLPVFSPSAGSATAIPSLSIGALGIGSGVILAGTGDPNDATDSYYGSGILRSTDSGSTWSLITESHDGSNGNHSFTGLGFSGFAFSTSSPGLVVAALSQSAEGVIVNAPDTINSVMGLYYSTDSGLTWQMSSIYDGSQIVQRPLPTGSDDGGNAATAVVWNPIRQLFFAAVRYHGYYQSSDGITWTRLLTQPSPSLTLAACPTNPGLPGNSSCPIFRGALSVQPATGDTFALTTDLSNRDQGLYQDQCALSGTSCASPTPTFAQHLNSAPLETGNGSIVIPQADYNLTLNSVPAGADTLLFVGTTDLYRCTLAYGCSLRNTTNSTNGCAAPAQVAPSQHAIATLATSSLPLVFLGNDGGLWRSTDGVNQQLAPCSPDDATHFQNLNSGLGSLAEVVSFAQHPTDPDTLLAGLGSNGTAATSSTPVAAPWPQLSAGEGGTVAINSSNPLLWTISTAAGIALRQCSNGPSCTSSDFTGPPTIGPTQTLADNALIDAPWLLDPALPASVLLGTCRVWRGPASDGTLWSSSNELSPLLAGPQNTSCGGSNPLLRSLAAGGPVSNSGTSANAGSEVLYAGMAGTLDGGLTTAGHLFSTASGQTASSSTAWADLALNPVTNDLASNHVFNPGGFDLSSIYADPHDTTGQTVYVTVMGFAGNGINAPHLYRSIDGGAHWLNVSSNLPNAPANSVLVDPNDANTVYLAMDTGVYVTTSITNCTSTNCWSIYGTGLPNAPAIQLLAAPAMPTGDGRVGELRVSTYGRGLWQLPLLTASTLTQPAMTLSPTDLTFSAQSQGTASPAQTVTVTNTGAAPLTISSITASGDFHQTSNCIGTSVAVNATCSVQVSFLPSATGTRTGLLTLYGNVSGGQATAALSGTATPPSTMVLNPVSLTFPSTTVGASSTAQNISLSNTSSTTASIQSITVSGDFQITSNTCGASLGPNTACALAILFTPTASGTRTGALTVSDSVGVQTAALSGTGTSPPTDTLSPLSLSFPSQPLATSSTPQQVTLTNSGDQPLTLISAYISAEPAAGDFTAVNSCGASLNGHSSCSIGITFTPQSTGAVTGTLTVADAFRSQTVALSGTGIAAAGVSLSPSNVLFPDTGVTTSSASQIVTLTNNTASPLSLSSPTLTGDFALQPGSNTCPASLAPASSCTLQLAFLPSSGGPRTGTLSFSDSASNSPQAVTLTGTGIDFTLSTDGASSATIANGQNAVYPLLLASAANIPGSATFTCSGTPANATCNITPATSPLGNTSLIVVTIDTGVSATATALATSSLQPPFQPADQPWHQLALGQQHSSQKSAQQAGTTAPKGQGSSLAAFACAAPLALFLLAGKKRRLPTLLLTAICATTLLTLAGCGAGRFIPLPGATPGTSPAPATVTPAGTYNLTISATSAGLTRTVSLALTVQ